MAALFFTLFALIFLLPFQSSSAQIPNRNITAGSFISTLIENRAWLSPSKDFAFGFYPLASSDLFLVAIWFDKIPDKTVVWTARSVSDDERNPIQAPAGSTARLVENGRLVVQNQQGVEIWSAKPSDPNVTHASMLDSGNFVLVGSSNPINKWQSFDNPTDTLLPSQILNKGSSLSARLKEDNFSNGRFQLDMQSDGNLVLNTVAYPTGNIYLDYWTIDTKGAGSQLVFNISGLLYITIGANSISNDSLPLYITIGANSISNDRLPLAQNTPIGSEYYHRLTVDFDGVLRKYVYRINGSDNSQTWSAVWSSPDNICTAITAPVGGGACGFNSYCTLDTSRNPACECPPGYSFVDPSNKFVGCKQDIVLQQDCLGDESNASSLFQLNDLQGVDWPLADFELLSSMNEDSCGQTCLVDCLCAVAIYGDGNCWKKKLPLSNGRKDTSVTRKVFIKVAKVNFSSPSAPSGSPSSPNSSYKNNSGLILIISVLFGSSAFVNLICLAGLSFSLVRNHKIFLLNYKKTFSPRFSFPSNLSIFTYKEIVDATHNFRDEVGKGGFGTVYKGSLPGRFNTSLAIKKLDKMTARGQKEFQTELIAINKVHHKNLQPMLGFCEEGPHRVLVYEFMSNGSLANFLFTGSERPSWGTRVEIAFGIARGLLYLHEECSTQIIHCDIKPENVLLDEHLNPKISDFGLAKLLATNQSQTTTTFVRGTKGYVAPEWFKRMAITTKVDVHSYGVMVLEIICCRKNVVIEVEGQEDAILTDWAYDCYRERTLNLLVENDAEASTDMMTVERLVKVAIWCIQEDPSLRPSMKKVNQMLEGTVEVHIPPNPYSDVISIG